ncbi:MAG: LptF/LptG family permease [Calditrichaeota bacterium]|nr:LptF/LptG family permease [Calditrichota bacterium]
MRLISRYIIKELTGPFLFSLAVIMFVFVIKFLLQYIGKIFGKGLAYETIFKFIFLNLAWMLALAVPMAVLVAALMAFGRLSADNEITILKSTGINLYRVITPALLWGTILTVAMVWYNDQVLPEFNHQARVLSHSISRKKPTLQIEEGIYLKLDKFNILVEKIEKPLPAQLAGNDNIADPVYPEANADKLKDVTIFDYSDPQHQRTVIADHGYLVLDEARQQLVFYLYDGEIHETDSRNYSEYRRIGFSKHAIKVPASDLFLQEVEDLQRGDREMNIQMMRDKIAGFRQQRQEAEERLQNEVTNFLVPPDQIAARLESGAAPDSAMATFVRRDGLTRASRKLQNVEATMRSNLQSEAHFERQIYKYGVEIQKKYSIPFACIVFILVGAPLGIRAKKGSLGIGVAFSILFFLLYWVCLIGGEDLADKQIIHPFLAMWFPNILVGSLGLYLTYKTVQETTFIQWEKLGKLAKFFTNR